MSPLNQQTQGIDRILPDSLIEIEDCESKILMSPNKIFEISDNVFEFTLIFDEINEEIKENSIFTLNNEQLEVLEVSQITNEKIDFLENDEEFNEYFEDNFSNIENKSNESYNKDEAILDICSDPSLTEESDSNFLPEKVSKIYKCVNSLYYKKILLAIKDNIKFIKTLILFFISIYNIIFIPLVIIFHHYEFEIALICFEILCSLFLLINFMKKFIKYLKAFRRIKLSKKIFPQVQGFSNDDENALILKFKSPSSVIFSFIFEILYIIPFHLIFTELDDKSKFYTMPLNFIRVIYVKPLIKGVSMLKQKNSLFGKIIHMLLLYILFAHVSACILIYLAFEEIDFNETFLRRIPAPEFSFVNEKREKLDVGFGEIYIHALYWVYSTISKTGAMDITIININEKIFAVCEMIFGGLLYIYIFGNVISIAEDLTPKIKSLLGKNKKIVISFLKNLKFDEYIPKIEVLVLFNF